jgi:hypothetical protein
MLMALDGPVVQMALDGPVVLMPFDRLRDRRRAQ